MARSAVEGTFSGFPFPVLDLSCHRTAFFTFRITRSIPDHLPDPPLQWVEPYAAMAEWDDLPWTTLSSVTDAARAFVDSVLAGAGGDWNPLI